MRVFEVGLNDEADAYAKCAATIKAGGLVAFPTETVYGLGADGLNVNALFALFEAKRRPLSDPVILHVARPEEAEQLWDVSDQELQVIRGLQKHFWPGPCTIVARQSSAVPKEATANSGFASSRMPSHPVARRFIEAAGCPIAGPSANLFGRITPTRAAHVQKYFADLDIDLLACDDCCGIGIESTVVKVVSGTCIEILREGAVTGSMIMNALTVKVVSHDRPITVPEGQSTASPGQLLRHYSPIVSTHLLLPEKRDEATAVSLGPGVVLLDVVGGYAHLKDLVGFYMCISEGRNAREISKHLFMALHEAESRAQEFSNAVILLGVDMALINGDSEELRGVYDRLYRAATGKFVYIHTLQ
eukprot:Blabericola_migrator_1__10998@NODE_637_length_7124_cov_71_025648_g468_i0_p3_GENE_NODE_637_length_7124_cov_71_025648_g468_i0NODE_637_length_7124_cov_71_025648_g468_i0_p3_ORF_typecomplete_len360_score48_35Sua5_yciO_yrdC/PF01300_18/7_8e46SUA5/PF03481_13/4_6e10_NODE_637_length_7124_cov_71_025648_g468_i015092588